ncbi:MAG: P-loop NTPase [Myxococcota bacterium]
MIATYAFFSVKGGVGKSALASAAGVASARLNRPVAVVDADLTGTSLADGLALRAPGPGPDGAIAWVGARPASLDRRETLRRRRDEAEAETPHSVPFYDVLINRSPRPEFDPATIAWTHDDHPGVRWYPSSPAPRETADSVRSMMRSANFGNRVLGSLGRIRESLGPEGVLLVDLPPGMFGVGTWVASLPELTPVLVTTDDRNDLYRSAHEFVRLLRAFPSTRWLLNRNHRAPEEVRRDLRSYLDNLLPGLENKLRVVGREADLERLFREDSLRVSQPLADRLVQLLEDT